MGRRKVFSAQGPFQGQVKQLNIRAGRVSTNTADLCQQKIRTELTGLKLDTVHDFRSLSCCIVSTASQEDSEKEVSSQGSLGRHA